MTKLLEQGPARGRRRVEKTSSADGRQGQIPERSPRARKRLVAALAAVTVGVPIAAALEAGPVTTNGHGTTASSSTNGDTRPKPQPTKQPRSDSFKPGNIDFYHSPGSPFGGFLINWAGKVVTIPNILPLTEKGSSFTHTPTEVGNSVLEVYAAEVSSNPSTYGNTSAFCAADSPACTNLLKDYSREFRSRNVSTSDQLEVFDAPSSRDEWAPDGIDPSGHKILRLVKGYVNGQRVSNDPVWQDPTAMNPVQAPAVLQPGDHGIKSALWFSYDEDPQTGAIHVEQMGPGFATLVNLP